jgi:hypothetical protein
MGHFRDDSEVVAKEKGEIQMRHQTVAGAAIALAFSSSSFAGNLFLDTFDTDTSANWTVNQGPGTNDAVFSFDYSTLGIPSAPNSTGGTTRGLRLRANVPPGAPTFGGLSVSPTGLSLSGNYMIRADVFLQAPGPFPAGGTGSTQVTGMGLGTAGVTAQWAGGVQDSVWFGATGDGGSSVDFRAYSRDAGTGYPDGSTVFAATGTGNRNNTHPYYTAFFTGVQPPAAQQTLFPGSQTGTTAPGAAGMTWREYRIVYYGGIAKFSIDGLLIATVDVANLNNPVAGSNILLNQHDINATQTTAALADLLAGIFDNVRVDSLLLGDIDEDGVVNNQDIAPFVAGLTGGTLSPSAAFNADVNQDGVLNNQDIAPFVALLTGGGSRPLADLAGDPEFAPLVALVPEPASLSFLAVGALALRRRR